MATIKHTVKIGDPDTIGGQRTFFVIEPETRSSEKDYASYKDKRLEELWEERHKLIKHIRGLMRDRGLSAHKRAEGNQKIEELEAENRAEGYITNAQAKREDANIAAEIAKRHKFENTVDLPMRLGANNPEIDTGLGKTVDHIRIKLSPNEKNLYDKWEATRKVTATGGRLAQLKEYRELEKKKQQERQQAQSVKDLVAQRAIAHGSVGKAVASEVTSSPVSSAKTTSAQDSVRGSRVAKTQAKSASAGTDPKRKYTTSTQGHRASPGASSSVSTAKAAPIPMKQDRTAARPRTRTPMAKDSHGHGATAPSSSTPRQEATQPRTRTRAASLADLSLEDMKNSNSKNQKSLQDFYSARYKDDWWVQEEKEYIEKKIEGLIPKGSHSVDQRVEAEYRLWGTDRRLACLMERAKVYFAAKSEDASRL